jgi:segregation and condensation protein B
MTLKSKLEAVIYAAEEPVTLAQLAALFAEDALELKAEREASAVAAAEQAKEDAVEAAALPQLEEGFAYLGLEESPADPAAQPQAASIPTPGPTAAGTEPQPAAEPAPTAPGTAEAPTSEPGSADSSAPDPEAEARRAARARDREIRSILQGLLDEIIAEYASDERGIEIREIAGGYRMATKPACHDAVRSFVRSLKPPLKLSLPALETLAVVAYKQPVTAPEVSEIRGVESAATLGSLLSRKLIATAGRKQVIGRPILYKTTREFLLRFGLKDVNELPSMEEFEKMAAVELDDQALDEAPAAAPGEEEPSVELDDSFERMDEDASRPDAATPDAAPASEPSAAAAATDVTAAPQAETAHHEN